MWHFPSRVRLISHCDNITPPKHYVEPFQKAHALISHIWQAHVLSVSVLIHFRMKFALIWQFEFVGTKLSRYLLILPKANVLDISSVVKKETRIFYGQADHKGAQPPSADSKQMRKYWPTNKGLKQCFWTKKHLFFSTHKKNHKSWL